jgi:hypoxanthine phosphoribosyltransferase
MTGDEAITTLAQAEEIVTAVDVSLAVRRMAAEIRVAMSGKHPLLLSVMGGAVVFTGQLVPLLHFPLELETIQVSRYGSGTSGGELIWKLAPRETCAGRTVLIVDDILDEGYTLAGIRDMVLKLGAREVYSAVFADKDIGRAKPIKADFVGVTLPNRFVFGFGMDIDGAWRNLPNVYALRAQ